MAASALLPRCTSKLQRAAFIIISLYLNILYVIYIILLIRIMRLVILLIPYLNNDLNLQCRNGKLNT